MVLGLFSRLPCSYRYFTEMDNFLFGLEESKGIGLADQLRAWSKHREQLRDEEDRFDAENDIFHPSGGGSCCSLKWRMQLTSDFALIIFWLEKIRD